MEVSVHVFFIASLDGGERSNWQPSYFAVGNTSGAHLALKTVWPYSSTQNKCVVRDGNRTKICRVKVIYLVMSGPRLGDSWVR